MTRTLAAMLFAAAFAAAPAPAIAADRNYSVSGFDHIKVIGPYRVRLTTGVAPFARASAASAAALDSVAIDVSGRILTVRRNPSAPSSYPGQPSGPVTIEIGTHELRIAGLIGSGGLDISGVRGMAFTLTVEGAGAARVDKVAVDTLKAWVAGSGKATLAGEAKSATLLVRGTSSLDGSALSVRDATIGSEGPATMRVTVTNAAKVDAKGLSEVILDGNPACTVTAAGSATVSGCKTR